ncbi:hypothetical protein H6P81_006564 [Aristolochia fimbriata]|uniref:Uncharacterized protein n=1 Tax=Aristolochia fimbriata TaxID=158543 RepID=A0AAV7EXN2_ARIFI|nr:hypothetical protein H6P81_006564 [Aristolochia fimbriata]
MEGMALWSYQQNIDELKQLLMYTSFELEAAKEAKRRNDETEKQLLYLLKETSRERDELREQLQKLLTKLCQTEQPCYVVPNLQSPNVGIPKGITSSNDSDSLSETYNSHLSSYGSPVDSLLDGGSLPEMSNLNIPDSSNIAVQQEYPAPTHIDRASLIIDQIAMKRKLPERGKFLEAVSNAGPLLKNLLVAGPLPQWRNPPPLQAFQIPPVAIKGRSAPPVFQKPVSSSYVSHRDTLNGVTPRCSNPVMNFGGTAIQKKRSVLSSGVGDDFLHGPCPLPALKHQKLQ